MNYITLSQSFSGAAVGQPGEAVPLSGPSLLVQTTPGCTATVYGSNLPKIEATWQVIGTASGYAGTALTSKFAFIRVSLSAAGSVAISATQNSTSSSTPGSGPVTSDDITDASAIGKQLLQAADAAAARAALDVPTTGALAAKYTKPAGGIPATDLDADPAGRTLLTATSAAERKQVLGLDQVSNTSDANKPISTATQTALDGKMTASLPAMQTIFDAGTEQQKTVFRSAVAADLRANEIAFIGDSRTRYGLRNWYKGATATTNVTALPIDYLGTAGVGVNADTTGALEYRAADKHVRWITAIAGDTQGPWTPLQLGRMTVESGGAGRGLTMVVRSLATMPGADVTVAFTLTASMYYLTGWDSTGGIAAYGFQTEVVSRLRNGPSFDYLGAGGAMSHEMVELLPWYAAQAGTTGIDVIRCGTNDISNTSISAATTIANMTQVFNARFALGRRLVICGEPARWGVNTSTPLTTQQRADLIAVNKAYRAFCDARPDTTRFVDLLSLSVDAGWSDLRPATGYLVDTVHDGFLGASEFGAAIAQACMELGARRAPPRMRGDTTNLMPAGMFAGTGGTAGAGVTGTVPTGFSAARRSGDADISAVSSLVARTDGQRGNWWQLAVTATAASQRMDMSRTADTLASLGLAAGDVVEFEVDAEVSALTGTLSAFEVFLFIYGGTSVRTQIVFPPRVDGVKYGRSPRIQIPAGTTNIQFNAQVFPGASSAPTVRLGDLFVRKVA